MRIIGPVIASARSSRRRGSRRFTRGVSVLELLAAALLIGLAAAGAVAHWRQADALVAVKRRSEMGVFVGSRAVEALKTNRYLNINLTGGSPTVTYYDRYGAPSQQAADRGYKVKTTVTSLVDRDGEVNAEDLRHLHIEVWDNSESTGAPYETVDTLVTFGGI